MSKLGYSPDCHVDLHAVFFILKKVLKKGSLTMAKISSWHFCHLLYVVWLEKACKRGVTGTPGFLELCQESKVENVGKSFQDSVLFHSLIQFIIVLVKMY